jgi:glycerol-3-phosphate acyltransferase PlsY
MIELGLKFTAAYLLGSIIGSLVVGALRGGVDIRTIGSGNAGGTNALRTQGKAFAFWVMFIDVGKGILAVLLLPDMTIPGVGRDPAISREFVVCAVAFAAILGHVYPLWYDFKGGKGGATAAGVIWVLAPGVAGPAVILWLGMIALTGFVGLATIAATFGAVAYLGFTELPEQPSLFVLAVATAVLIVHTHRDNIGRIMDGTEARMGRIWGGR